MSLTNDSATKDSGKTSEPQLYVLFYRHGVNPGCQKGFKHNGDLRSAVERAKKHCEIMNYRYVFVRPMICDLVAEEKQKMERGDA